MALIHFHEEDVEFKVPNEDSIAKWIENIVVWHDKNLKELNFIFCSDEYLIEINKQFLNHHFYTDIITFDNSDQSIDIEGDIFISIERVRENAQKLNNPFIEELHRVLIHGVLHLLGHHDSSPEEKALMRKTEDHYLTLRNFDTDVPRGTLE